MNFFNPLAWIGLLSIPIILFMYLLKQKYVNITVPSLFLWKSAANISRAERPWQKLVKNLLMFLQILIALLLVISLANPYFLTQAEALNAILVIDGSMSMQATDTGDSRFASAKDEMIKFVEQSAPNTNITVVYAAKTPYIAINESTDKKSITDKIKTFEPAYTAVDENALESLLGLLSQSGEFNIYLFSDQSYDFEAISKEDVVFGQSVANTAVTLVAHAAEQDRVIILVKVKNYGDSPVSNAVCIYCDGTLIEVKDIELAPFEEKDVFFTEVPPYVKNIEAKLSQGDFLTADDSYFDYVNEPAAERAVLVTNQNIFLENILSLLPNVELYKTEPENMETLSGYFLYVFDGVLPEKLPTDGHLLVFNPPEGNALLETAEEISISAFSTKDNALLKLVGDFKFDVLKSKRITPPPWGQVVLSGAETPLIVTGQTGSQKVVVMGFDLHNTDLPLKKEFPIFMYNLAQFFIPEGAAAQSTVKAGDAVSLNTLPDAKSVKVSTPDNALVTIAPPFPVYPFDGANAPGFYTLAQETASQTFYSGFAVNADGSESDLTRNARISGTQTVYKNSVPVNTNLTSIFLALSLLILLAEWWVFARGH